MPSIINELESNNMTATIPSHARSESGGRYSPPDTVKAGHATIHNTNHSNDYRSRQRFESTADGDVRVMVDNPTYNNEPSSSTASTSVIPPKKSAFQKRHTRNLSAHFSEGARISSEGGDGDMDGRPVSATFTYDAPTMATYNAPPRRHHEQQQQAPYNHPPQGHHSSPDQFYMSPTSFHYKSAATSSSGNHPPPLPVGVGGARDYPSMQQQAVDETGGGDGAAGHKHRRGFSGGVSNPAHAHRRINSQGGSAPVERTKTTTTIQPQSQYYDGSNQIREAPRRSHHRVTSAGLDMLSAAAGVSKEDLAAAAGPNRPDSAFASMIPPPSSSSQPIMPRHAAGPVVEQHSPQEGHLTSYHSTYNSHHNNDPSSSQDYNNHQEYYQGRPYPPQQQHPQSQYYPHPSFHNHNNHHQQQHALSPRAYSFYPQQSCVQTTTQPNMLAHQQHQHPASPVRYDEPQELKIETDELLFANKNGHIPPPTPPTPRHRYAPSCSSIGTLVFDPKMDPSPAKNLHLGGLDGVVVEEDRKTTGSDTFSTTNTGNARLRAC